MKIYTQSELFSLNSTSTKTCRSCKNRQRWKCNSKIIQYCGVTGNGRTFNKLLKIKAKKPACEKYEAEKKGDNSDQSIVA